MWENIVPNISQTNAGTAVNYTCAEGYGLSDGRDSAVTVCKRDGTWEPASISCIGKCAPGPADCQIIFGSYPVFVGLGLFYDTLSNVADLVEDRLNIPTTEASSSVNIGTVVTTTLVIVFGLIVALDIVTYGTKAKYKATLDNIHIRPKGRRHTMKDPQPDPKRGRRRKVPPKNVPSTNDYRSFSRHNQGAHHPYFARGPGTKVFSSLPSTSRAGPSSGESSPLVPVTCDVSIFDVSARGVHIHKAPQLYTKYYKGKEALSYPKPITS